MKKDILKLARDELLKLDQTVRDCSDRFMELAPLDLEMCIRDSILSRERDIIFINEEMRREICLCRMELLRTGSRRSRRMLRESALFA